MDKYSILVVDDVPDNIDILKELLSDKYKVLAAVNGKGTLKIAKSKLPDLILLDVMMPGMDGYEVCQILKDDPVTKHIPVIFATAKTEAADEARGFDVGAVDYITKPISPITTLARVSTHLNLADQTKHLGHLVSEKTEDIYKAQEGIIGALGRAAEFKDNETGLHVVRMSYYARFIAEDMGADPDWCELLFQAAPMHDVGKIGISDSVLLKPGKLDDEEWTIMQKHAEFGSEILGAHDSPLLALASEVAYNHHEKWNGKGYPQGLKEKDIPLSARIVAIADVFDALTSERPYKKAWPEEKAINLIKEEAGKHFAPVLVDHFLNVLPRISKVMLEYKEQLEGNQ